MCVCVCVCVCVGGGVYHLLSDRRANVIELILGKVKLQAYINVTSLSLKDLSA